LRRLVTRDHRPLSARPVFEEQDTVSTAAQPTAQLAIEAPKPHRAGTTFDPAKVSEYKKVFDTFREEGSAAVASSQLGPILKALGFETDGELDGLRDKMGPTFSFGVLKEIMANVGGGTTATQRLDPEPEPEVAPGSWKRNPRRPLSAKRYPPPLTGE
jgi:hypothetical protein